MSDALMQHEQADRLANKLLPQVKQWQRNHLLWQAAYKKRIKPVPTDTMNKAVKAFAALVRDNRLQNEDIDVLQLTMDKLSDLLWKQMNSAQQEWLINQL